MKKFNGKMTALAIVLAGMTGTAMADKFKLSDSEFYIGGGYGQYSIQFDDDDVDFDEDSEVLRGFAGVKFNEFLGAEIAYLNFDEANEFDNSAEIDGISIAAILSAPIHEYISVYIKGGWFEWDADIKADIPVIGRVSNDVDGGDTFWGAGVKFGLGDHLDLRVEYERYEIDEDFDPELDVASISLQYVFD